MPTRDELHQLVASLPEDAFPAAYGALTHMQVWPPPELAELEKSAQAMERRMQERLEQMRQRGGSGGGGIGGGASWIDGGRVAGDAGRHYQRARHSTGYERDGDSVHESDIVYDEHEFFLVERISRDPETQSVTFTIELTGPGGHSARHEHRYDAR